ncbi:MAG: nitrilase-related carbon-nitrogen hydrolase [Thermodesulfobacteriota bacterium]|nr:nitrilase-related carbon-nitrogen hydrolase [Thermodesulfobacteriota bacterium]
MDDLKIAAVCMNAEPGHIETNLNAIQGFLSKAVSEGAQIICFPELSVTGYTLKAPRDVYRSIPYERVMERLTHMAEEAGAVFLVGLIDISRPSRPSISQAVFGPKGLIGVYQKTHLSYPEENLYEPGQDNRVFSHGSTTFGIQICYETHFPEISTTLALMGAELLFIPYASPRGDPEEKLKSWMRVLPARAFDNGVFIVACNQTGETEEGLSFPGVAVVLGPDGQVLEKYVGWDEGMVLAELRAEMLIDIRENKMKYFLDKRRPELYGNIVASRKPLQKDI